MPIERRGTGRKLQFTRTWGPTEERVKWKVAIRHKSMMPSEEMGSMSYKEGTTLRRSTQTKLGGEGQKRTQIKIKGEQKL